MAVDSKDDMSQQLEVFVRCQNLPKKDNFSDSDPFVVLSVKDASSDRWQEADRSETIKNDNNPKFAKLFHLPYYFEEVQRVRIDVYDSDGQSKSLDKHDFIGRAELVLGEAVSAAGQTVTIKLFNKKGKPIIYKHKNASVTFTCEDSATEHWNCQFNFSASKLARMDMFGGADPYFKIFREQGNSWQEVYKSEIIMKNNKNPNWKPFRLSSQKLCNGDFKRRLRIEVWDWDNNSDDDLIGKSMEFKADDLFQKGFTCQLQLPKKDKSRGVFFAEQATREKQRTFLEYLKGGTQMSLMIAIDYTGSNGTPVTHPNSLHYYDPANPYQHPNQYVEAMTAVGNVLAPYDSDNKFPVWAFGARKKSTKETLMCEPISQLAFPQAPDEIQGIEAVLYHYRESFKYLDLYGPTNFATFLGEAQQRAGEAWKPDEQVYHVLLILTDGAISDMQKTKKRLIACSSLPLSVVIIGVGKMNSAALKSMDELDGDDGLITQDKRKAERDFVQFVEFGKKKRNIAKETLAELPGQFLEYMKKHKVKPLDPEIRIAKQRDLFAQSGQSRIFHTAAPIYQPSSTMQQQFQVPQGPLMVQPEPQLGGGIPGGPMVSPGYAPPGTGVQNMQPQMNIQPPVGQHGAQVPLVQSQFGGVPGGPMMSSGYAPPGMSGPGMGIQPQFVQMNIQPPVGQQSAQGSTLGNIQPLPIYANPAASAPPPDSSAPPSYSP